MDPSLPLSAFYDHIMSLTITNPSTPNRPFESHFTVEDWYKGSVSEMMNNYNGQWRVVLPEDYRLIVRPAQLLSSHTLHTE